MSKEEEKSKTGKAFDKVIMGAVIGGAIGSVLGASIAPKKGTDTRKDISEAAVAVGKKGKGILSRLTGFFKKKVKTETPEKGQIPVPTEAPSTTHTSEEVSSEHTTKTTHPLEEHK